MRLYRVSLVQTVYESATIEIEAADQDEAERLALARASKAEWRFDDAAADAEVVGCDEVTQ